jgi:hypothetical protein
MEYAGEGWNRECLVKPECPIALHGRPVIVPGFSENRAHALCSQAAHQFDENGSAKPEASIRRMRPERLDLSFDMW